jgi:hypothetical protein
MKAEAFLLPMGSQKVAKQENIFFINFSCPDERNFNPMQHILLRIASSTGKESLLTHPSKTVNLKKPPTLWHIPREKHHFVVTKQTTLESSPHCRDAFETA